MSGPIFLGCGFGDLLSGGTTELVGVEDDPSGALRAYIGARYRGLYVLIDDAEGQQVVRDAWASRCKVLMPLPASDQIHSTDDVVAS